MNFNVGDRVRFVSPYEAAVVGDTGTVIETNYDCTRVSLDRLPDVAPYPYSHRLELIEEEPALNFAAGKEPSTGEQYLDRAIDWLSDNSDDTYDISVQDALAVANFLREVDSRQ